MKCSFFYLLKGTQRGLIPSDLVLFKRTPSLHPPMKNLFRTEFGHFIYTYILRYINEELLCKRVALKGQNLGFGSHSNFRPEIGKFVKYRKDSYIFCKLKL